MPNPAKMKYQFDFRNLAVELFRYKKFNEKTDSDIARLLSISEVSLSYKLRGMIPFRVQEIMQLRELLGLSDEDVGRLFFTVRAGT